MGVNTTGLLNTQTEVYASYKNDAVTKNKNTAMRVIRSSKSIRLLFPLHNIFCARFCNWTDTDCGWCAPGICFFQKITHRHIFVILGMERACASLRAAVLAFFPPVAGRSFCRRVHDRYRHNRTSRNLL